jgi:hypothetical protein
MKSYWLNSNSYFDKYSIYRRDMNRILSKIVPIRHFVEKKVVPRKKRTDFNIMPKVPPVNKEMFKQEFIQDEWLNPNDIKRYNESNEKKILSVRKRTK